MDPTIAVLVGLLVFAILLFCVAEYLYRMRAAYWRGRDDEKYGRPIPAFPRTR